MPLYRFELCCSLTPSQQDELAKAVTKIHSEKFTTPSLFVNVTFTDISSQMAYVAGKRRTTNRLLAHIRTGPSRTMEDYDAITSSLSKAWSSIVGDSGDKELRAVFLLGDLLTGSEAGFPIPPAGQDKQWLKEHHEGFERKAREGDDEFVDLLKEIRERKDLRDALE